MLPVTNGLHARDQESYVMACVTRPAVEHLERSLKALQEAVAGRRADIAAKEAALAADNPPAFRALQARASLCVRTPAGQ